MIISDEFLKEVKDYCGEYSTDNDSLITSLINSSDEYIKGAVGNAYTECERSNLIIKVIINDFYSKREYMESTKVSANTRKLIDSMILQMQMEARSI